MSKSSVKDFILQVSAAVVSGLLLAGILSSNTFFQSVWATFPLPSIIFWLAFAFVVIRIGYWIVTRLRKYLSNRDMINRITQFLHLWDELGEAYRSGNSGKVGELMSRGMILYTPIGSFIRSQARATYIGTPDHPIINRDFDLIGNLLAGNTSTGIDFSTSWRMGRQAILGSLGMLGYRPKSALTEQQP